MNALRWTRCDDAEQLARRARERISAAAAEAIDTRGRFALVLAGGSTPRRCYELLRDTPQHWSAWHIYFGDERCLAPDHPQRNSRLAADALLDHVPVPAAQVHLIAAERGAEAAAQDYRRCVAEALPFDLVLLGVGEDGHTASLFPGQTAPAGASVYAVHDAPKPPPQRVTLAATTLGRCRQLLFLVSGAGKRGALRQWRAAVPLPAAGIPCHGVCEALVDAAAWGEAPPP